MKKYNVGIVGYGWAASAHIPAINHSSLAQVTAICSSRPQDSDALSVRHGGRISTYANLDAMLRDPSIHVVSICSTPHLHADQIVAAAEAGKHLIIEKPISLTVADAHRIAAAVAKANVRTCVCFECRYSSQFVVTRSLVDSGLLGSLHYGEVDYFHGVGPWYGQFRWNVRKDSGGSALLSAGCHAVDALLFCMDGEVESVTSMDTASASPIFAEYEYPTTSVTLMRFAGGAIGKCAAVIDCLQPYNFHTHLVGSEGSLLGNRFYSQKLATDRHEWNEIAMKLADSGDVADHPYEALFEAFFDSLERGEEMPRTALRHAMKSHLVCLAADISARERRAVRLSEIS